MKRLLTVLLLFLLNVALAQQSATLSGLIKTEGDITEGTRVAVHLVDRDGVWQEEIVSVSPVAGTFSITADSVEASRLLPFRSGAVLLPGMQNEYRISPDDVNYVKGQINMYVDKNGNDVFDLNEDEPYLGIASLEAPVGFFTLLYVDKDAVLSGGGTDLNLSAGWNIFTVRFPEGAPLYEVQPEVDGALLDVFLLEQEEATP